MKGKIDGRHSTEKRQRRQPDKYYAPLQVGDTEIQTVGCRIRNPFTCGKNSLQDVCAFVRDDGICFSPPNSWPKQFKLLSISSPTRPVVP